MNFRTTLLLMVLVIAAGVTLYFTKGRDDKPAASTTENGPEHKLLDIESGDVNRIAITGYDGKKFVLQKTGSDWKLTEPVSAAAKTWEANGLVSAIVALQSRGQLDASKKSSGGLDHPSYVVELSTTAGKSIHLAFGDKPTVGESLYVQLNDNAKPDVVGSGIYSELEKPATAYRETRLVSTPREQIQQIVINNNGAVLKLEKTGDTWQIVQPVALPAELSSVTDILTAITSLNVTEFIDNPRDLSRYNLNRPRTTVWFSTRPASTQPAATPGPVAGGQTLRFGSYQDITKKNIFVSLDDKDIALAPTTAERSFEKTPLDLRNRELVNIDPEKVSGFTVSINRPATTQPTTKPADLRQFTIERRKETAPVLGPSFPASAPAATTASALATTQSAATLPSIAATQPTEPLPKWFFASGGTGAAEDGQVQALLDTFHPLRVERYSEKVATTQPIPAATFTLTLHAIPGKASESAEDLVFKFADHVEQSYLFGSYKDVDFQVDRKFMEKLTGDFKTKKAPPPVQPAFPSGPGGQLPPGD